MKRNILLVLVLSMAFACSTPEATPVVVEPVDTVVVDTVVTVSVDTLVVDSVAGDSI